MNTGRAGLSKKTSCLVVLNNLFFELFILHQAIVPDNDDSIFYC